MQILYICSIMPPYAGGAAVDYGIILKSLVDYHGKRFKQIRVLTERGCNKIESEKVKIDDILFNYDSAAAGNKSFFKQFLNYFIILYYILFTSNDVVQIHARYVYAKYVGRIIFLALLLSPSRVFIDIRDRFYSNFGKWQKFIVCSEELMEYYSWLSKKTYIPVPLMMPPLDESTEQKHQIAYIGSIVENKGVTELLNGYEEYLKESTNPMELHFWGMNFMGKGFQKKARAIERLKYLGVVPNDQIYDIIMRYKAVILPSPSEGMPRICLETMFCNRIIVCPNNIKSIASYIPREFVLKSLNPEELKEMLLFVEAYDRKIAYSYDFSIHSPQKVSDKLLELYKQIEDGDLRHV